MRWVCLSNGHSMLLRGETVSGLFLSIDSKKMFVGSRKEDKLTRNLLNLAFPLFLCSAVSELYILFQCLFKYVASRASVTC